MGGVAQQLMPLTQFALTPDSTGVNSFCMMPEPYMGKAMEWTFYIVFSVGSAAGTVLIESAHSRDFTGTWALEATVAWAAASSVKSAHFTGIMQACRVRISSAITTGTIQVWATCATRGS